MFIAAFLDKLHVLNKCITVFLLSPDTLHLLHCGVPILNFKFMLPNDWFQLLYCSHADKIHVLHGFEANALRFMIHGYSFV